MNRIQTIAPPPEPLAFAPQLPGTAWANYSAARGDAHFAFFAPLHYEANYAYPLFVWLHGPGDDESQLKRIMPLVSMRNYVAVAARGTRAIEGRRGFAWSQNPADLALAEQRVFELVELAQARFHIAGRRVFVAGFDCGGTMAFRLAMQHPRRFAGVLSLAGPFPAGQAALARLADARRVPLFLACGRDSLCYPATTVCDDLKLLHSAGMNVALRQYPCGHEIAPQMLSDMDRWMMEQVAVGGRCGSH